MQRRQFARTMAATVGLARITDHQPTPSTQSTNIVVDGLDTSIVNEGFLGLLKTGGVDCVHKSLGDPASYAATYALLARHRETILPAVTVAEIREAKVQRFST